MERYKSEAVSIRNAAPPHCRKGPRSPRYRLPALFCSTALIGIAPLVSVSSPASAQIVVYGSTQSVVDNANADIIGRPSVASGTISIVGPSLDTITYIRDSDDAIIGIVDDGHYDRSVFINGASAGSATFNVEGAPDFFDGSSVSFYNTSNAGNSTINNNAFGNVTFYDTSSASNSIINGGSVIFSDGSTAGNATLSSYTSFHDNSTAGNATINIGNVDDGGFIGFGNNSTAGSATIVSNGGEVQFTDASSADSATLTNHDGTVFFMDTSTAGHSTIDNDAGRIVFGNVLATRNGVGDYGYFGGAVVAP